MLLYLNVKRSDYLTQVKHFLVARPCVKTCSYSTAYGWVCVSVCLIVGSCVSVLDEDKCSVLFFQLSYNSLSSGYRFCEAETSSHPALGWWEASGFFFFFFFFCLDEKEKKVQYFNPPSLSHVQASICISRSHVIIPFQLWLLPQRCFTAAGVFLVPAALHNLHHAELCRSHLTSVIWRHNRLFISVAEMASRSCFCDAQSEGAAALRPGGKSWHERDKHDEMHKTQDVQYHMAAACSEQTTM